MYRLVSSANKLSLNLLEEWTMSLIYIKKSNGPKIDPCGTPKFVSTHLESKLSKEI